MARQLGWTFQEGEPDSISQLRTLVIPLAANNGDEELLAEARIKFERFITGQPDEIHPNLRGSIFALNVKFGGSKEYEAVLEIYKNTKVADQKTAALSALTASRDIALINRTLEMSLQESEVRPQDIIYIFRNIISNEVARRPTWQFVKTNWARIYEKFAGGSISLLSSIVSASTGSLTTLKDAEDIEDFFKDKETASFSRVIAQSIEKVIMAARWLERDRQPIADWLKEQKDIKWN